MTASLSYNGYRPGVIARAVALHMDYYAPLWGFGVQFEAKVAAEMGEFHARYDPCRDLFIAVFDDEGALLGTITIDGLSAAEEGAHLRWFIVAQTAQGSGLGKELMRRADAFLRERGYRKTYLTTFAGLDAARALYERYGFELVSEEETDPWSGQVGIQRFERRTNNYRT